MANQYISQTVHFPTKRHCWEKSPNHWISLRASATGVYKSIAEKYSMQPNQAFQVLA